MMMTIVTNPGQCNQVTPKLLFVGIVFVLPGLGCIAASDRVGLVACPLRTRSLEPVQWHLQRFSRGNKSLRVADPLEVKFGHRSSI